MSNSDKKIQNGRVKIPGSELTMPAPPPEAHWTVYKITGPDGKVYIGQTGEPLKVRWSKGYHLSYKSGRGAIREAMQKYGKENFRMEPLCENLTQEGAWELEAKFIELYDSMNPEKGYNGKTGGMEKGCKWNEAAKQKLIQLNEQSPEYRKARAVQCIETGVIYSSQREAQRMTGINTIHKACTGVYVYAGGYHWRFVEKE